MATAFSLFGKDIYHGSSVSLVLEGVKEYFFNSWGHSIESDGGVAWILMDRAALAEIYSSGLTLYGLLLFTELKTILFNTFPFLY